MIEAGRYVGRGEWSCPACDQPHTSSGVCYQCVVAERDEALAWKRAVDIVAKTESYALRSVPDNHRYIVIDSIRRVRAGVLRGMFD